MDTIESLITEDSGSAPALEARGILTRPGLHCAPLTHRAIGTFPDGTCRISFGPFTREEHVRRVATELFQLAEGQPADVPIDAPETLIPAPEDLAR